MTECKHGLRQGCSYCHARTARVGALPAPRKRTRASSLSEKMNERMTELNRRLRALRGQ